jgi:hypothetical protein
MPADAAIHHGARRLSFPTRFFYGFGSVADLVAEGEPPSSTAKLE